MQGEGGGWIRLSQLRRFLPGLWTPAILAADFLTKRLVLAHIDALHQKVELLGDLLRFTYVRNPGAAMGLFPVGRVLLIAISLAASLVLTVLFFRIAPHNIVRRSAIAAILGGALGNLVDRIFYDGLVVDFIDVGLGSHRFYTFNVADMAVTLGGAVLFVSLLRESRSQVVTPANADLVESDVAGENGSDP